MGTCASHDFELYVFLSLITVNGASNKVPYHVVNVNELIILDFLFAAEVRVLLSSDICLIS